VMSDTPHAEADTKIKAATVKVINLESRL
jgi:hypothetical protein